MPRILIVEDESIVADDLAALLQKAGYEIMGIAASGRKAIEIAKADRPDVILMDVRIHGDLNGIETAIIIQGHFDDPVPLVFLTAMPTGKYPELAAVYPYIYVNKPIKDEDLIAAVRKALAAPVP